jgi:hypothetical protein
MCNHVLSTSWPPNRKHFCAYTCMYMYFVKFSSQSYVYRFTRRPATAHHQSPSLLLPLHTQVPMELTLPSTLEARRRKVHLDSTKCFTLDGTALSRTCAVRLFVKFHAVCCMSQVARPVPWSLYSFPPLSLFCRTFRRYLQASLAYPHGHSNPRMLWTSPTHQIAAADCHGI